MGEGVEVKGLRRFGGEGGQVGLGKSADEEFDSHGSGRGGDAKSELRLGSFLPSDLGRSTNGDAGSLVGIVEHVEDQLVGGLADVECTSEQSNVVDFFGARRVEDSGAVNRIREDNLLAMEVETFVLGVVAREGAISAILPMGWLCFVLSRWIARARIVEVSLVGPAGVHGGAEDFLAGDGRPSLMRAVEEDVLEVDAVAGPGRGVAH